MKIFVNDNMSKPISFGFGKPKSANTDSNTSLKPPPTSISFPAKKASVTPSKTRSTLRIDDDEDADELEPKHEAVAGFSSSGAILSKPTEEKKVHVIENPGNQDWRQRGKSNNILPNEVRAARQGEDVVMTEKDEVSTASGLQFAVASGVSENAEENQSTVQNGKLQESTNPVSADEEALQALLGDDDRPRGNAVIEQQSNTQSRPRNETDDFRADVASRPNSSTLDEYAAMPVEEFGMAMLRGMGKKRRANGEVINLEQKEENQKKFRKQEGFLGIGAKAAPGMDSVELGAWGKADMRKNSKGAGFFTPLMMKNRATGETITEDELEKRKRDAKENRGEDDWRDRRDRNLERHGRESKGSSNEKFRDEMNGFSRRNREESGYDSSRSRRDRDDSDYDSSRSRNHRSRSRDRRRKDDGERRYDSSSSRKERDRDRDKDRRRHRESDKDRDREYRHQRDHERNDRRHRDSR